MTTDTPTQATKPIRKPRKAAGAATTAVGSASAVVEPSTAMALVHESGDATDSGSATGPNFVSQAQDTVRKVANAGKDRATDALSELSDMIEEVARTIDDRVGGKYGDYARKASGSITGVADNLKSKDVDELLDDAREFVRTQPAVAIGAAAAVGFVLTRLIKSGADDRA